MITPINIFFIVCISILMVLVVFLTRRCLQMLETIKLQKTYISLLENISKEKEENRNLKKEWAILNDEKKLTNTSLTFYHFL